jgi:hypothetical protein
MHTHECRRNRHNYGYKKCEMHMRPQGSITRAISIAISLLIAMRICVRFRVRCSFRSADMKSHLPFVCKSHMKSQTCKQPLTKVGAREGFQSLGQDFELTEYYIKHVYSLNRSF